MIHIFDLDKTLWETFDKYGNSIWAKQLIFPIKLENEDLVLDDVGSSCKLKPGARDYLKSLNARGCQIGYLSVGRHWSLGDEHQPSLALINIFGLKDYFNHLQILGYKTNKKSQYLLAETEKITFYDDDANVIQDLKQLSNVHIIDASKISDWRHLLKND